MFPDFPHELLVPRVGLGVTSNLARELRDEDRAFRFLRRLHARLPDYANALWPGPRPKTLVVHRVTNKRAPVVDVESYGLSGTAPTSSLPSPEVGLTIVLHTHGPMPKMLPRRPARTRLLGQDAKGRDSAARRRDARGPSTIAAFPKKHATLRSLVLVEWGDDAKRAITKTTPLPSRRKPKVETNESGRKRHTQALFSNVLVREGTIGGLRENPGPYADILIMRPCVVKAWAQVKSFGSNSAVPDLNSPLS